MVGKELLSKTKAKEVDDHKLINCNAIQADIIMTVKNTTERNGPVLMLGLVESKKG